MREGTSMATIIRGQITTDSESASLAECRVEVFFDQLAHAALPERRLLESGDRNGSVSETHESVAPPIHRHVSARTNNAGNFAVRLPDEADLRNTEVRFVVSSPSGQVVADVFLPIDEAVRIPVNSNQLTPIVLAAPNEPSKRPTRRIMGGVFERNGGTIPSGLQVMIFAQRRDDEGIETLSESPILVAHTDSTGYFFGEAPNEQFESAAALVAGFPAELAIMLEDGLLPSRIPLVVDFPETWGLLKTEDCNCDTPIPRAPTQADIANAPGTYSTDLGTGRCVQFNTPNRAIEEFDFYTVVRTTEPAIRGTGTIEAMLDSQEAEAAEFVAKEEAAAAEMAEAKAVAAELDASYKSGEIGMPILTQNSAGVWVVATPAEIAIEQAKRLREAAEAKTNAAVLRARATAAAARAGEAARAASAARTTATLRAAKAAAAAKAAQRKPGGRVTLNANYPVDWDSTPMFYEAAEIAHGHLLHFKQVWYADGYSLGDLLYSVPLAPGQKKLISVVDWERRESTEREESTFGTEQINALLSHDRDLGEVVTGTLTESSRGGSKSTSVGVGVGTGAAGNGSYQGFNFGALIGVSGGYGDSNSLAWQNSARALSSTSLQGLRDRTLQSASAVRSLRSSVVHTVSQGESVTATTEVIANHNHCHALTIQYFEVLRHLKLEHELTDVQECLFVPLPMAEFDLAKILRWRQSLQTFLQRRELMPGFEAGRRVDSLWSSVDYPLDRYADEMVSSISGELQLSLYVPLPPLPERPKRSPTDTIPEFLNAVSEATNPTTGFLAIVAGIASGGATLVAGAATNAAIKATAQGARTMADQLDALPTAQERYAMFQRDVMPNVAAGFVDQLQLSALVSGKEVQVPDADFTLVSAYQPGVPLLVSVRGNAPAAIRRGDVTQLFIKSAAGLPDGCRTIVNAATLRYRTLTFQHDLVDDQRVNDDIELPKMAVTFNSPFDVQVSIIAPGKGVALYTPLDAWEQRRPRTEDRRLCAELIEHLNDNLEFYHHALWWTMDPNRRFMLLDGFYAPGSNNQSVASVVDNQLIGIVGNSLVLPVARGNHLDPRFRPEMQSKGSDLLSFYALTSPLPPSRVSLPTRGVFAEAVMGSCNACEEMDESRLWRWDESPIDEPPLIDTASTATRRSEPTSAQPTSFPTPIVSIQNAPSVPDPAGVRAALDSLSKESFADITGLAGTQANAAAAYARALDTAFKFGQEASTLAQQASMTKSIDKTMGTINKAESEGKIDSAEAKKLRTTALEKLVGTTGGELTPKDVAERVKLVDQLAATDSISQRDAQELNKSVLRSLTNGVTEAREDQAAAADLINGFNPKDITSITAGGGGPTIIQTAYNATASDVTDSRYWADLIRFEVPSAVTTTVTARGLQIQKINDGYGDVNLDWFQVLITKLPNQPGTNNPFDELGLFEYVRKNFPVFLQPFPRTGKPHSFEAYEATDNTSWLTSAPLGSVLLFTIDPNPLPPWSDLAFPGGIATVPELGLVACSEYVSDTASGNFYWNFSTLRGPNPIGYHPVSGTRQFGLGRKRGVPAFYIRAADRTTTLAEYAGSALAFSGADRYWDYFQTKLAEFVISNGGTAERDLVWSRRYDWRRVRDLAFGPGTSMA